MAGRDGDLIRLVGDPRMCLVSDSAEGDGTFVVLSPAVGLFDMPPAVGTFVRPGSFAGYLTVMRRYYHLLIPEGHHGVVTSVNIDTRKERVEFRQPLFTVNPKAESVITSEFKRAKDTSSSPDEGIPEGMFGLRSPTDGIFYARPNPQSPAYVEVGSVVVQGAALGLVEVLKCFNPIVYPGEPEFPAKARITRIAAKDSSEVKHGSVLFVVEAL